MAQGLNSASQGRPLYTADERRRRDSTIWTLVQGILAPLQFVVFLVSLALVIRFLWTGQGAEAAIASVDNQDADPVRHHDYRIDLGKGGVRQVSVCTSFFLGRRCIHAGAGIAHGISGGLDISTGAIPASRC